jgi:hypothetical protein
MEIITYTDQLWNKTEWMFYIYIDTWAMEEVARRSVQHLVEFTITYVISACHH